MFSLDSSSSSHVQIPPSISLDIIVEPIDNGDDPDESLAVNEMATRRGRAEDAIAIAPAQSHSIQPCSTTASSSMSAALHRPLRAVRRLVQFRNANSVASAIRAEAGALRRIRTVPRWMRVMQTVYHDYGLKHVMLISVLIVYQFLGAGIFYFCEASVDDAKEIAWKEHIDENRTAFIAKIIPTMFNNSDYLFFLTMQQTSQVEKRLNDALAKYEKQLGIKYSELKIPWDFWNAMLYAQTIDFELCPLIETMTMAGFQTICTTIGYGHLYPSTVAGRVFTMLYAIIGIPLVLSILDDLGKLLTKFLKTPWWLLKSGCRRAFRYCTKQTMAEIRRLDEEDKRDLEIFDLPVPIAIFVVIAWIFICSATFCIWERDWDYFVAFYFFFISLSTIGLGDITPTEPKYLLMLFIYIIIGLSLVSMCINLIQAKLERTYEAGRNHFDPTLAMHPVNHLDDAHQVEQQPPGVNRLDVPRRGSSLGIFRSRSGSSSYSLNREAVQSALQSKKKLNKTSQTVLSFPSPSKSSHVARSVSLTKMKFLPRTLSIDDVMKLVDTEEGDLLVLTELVRDEESCISETSTTTPHSEHSNQIVVSKSFETSSFSLPSGLSTVAKGGISIASLRPSHPSLHDLEAIEELEDRIAMGQNPDDPLTPAVHFRSRLSLIPEKHSVIDEEAEDPEEEDDDDDSRLIDQQFSPATSASSLTVPRIISPTDSRKVRLAEAAPGTISRFIGNLLGNRNSNRRRSNTSAGGSNDQS